MNEQQVEVRIGSRRYRLRGADPEALQALAARVDAELGDIAGPGGDKDDFKVAVLAALNLSADHEDQCAAWLADLRRLAKDSREVEVRLQKLLDGL